MVSVRIVPSSLFYALGQFCIYSFVVPLLKKSDNWVSFHDNKPHCGYYLNAEIGFDANVPNVPLAWIAQSASLVTSDCTPSDLYVPMLTALDLTWEMVLLEETAETLALLGQLTDLHVFVQVPILDSGRIAEPQICWSTHPTLKDTSQIPLGTFKIRLMWQVQTVWAWWERHHYDVAKCIQEEYGFDSKTNAAAEALALPLFEACDPNSSPLLVEDEWCTGKVFELDPRRFLLSENLSTHANIPSRIRYSINCPPPR
ncbi:hypothetical protein C8R47DRAFT_540035 [Mycena vitilis]|nr:hypothetical protein C8R47DRAFT_540035 [Mycena vitilis]